jgi:hypothetical protein
MRRPGTARRWAPSLVLALVVLVTTANGAAAAPGSRKWLAFYNGPNGLDDSANAVAVAPDGGAVFVTGTSYNTTTFPSETDITTVAYDADQGQQLWAVQWDGSGEHDVGYEIAVTPDSGTVLVAGISEQSSRPRVVTIAYDAVDGSELWSRRFIGPNGGATSSALAVSLDGSTVFVSGASEGADASDFRTVAYATSTGTVSWTSRADDSRYDLPMAVAVDPSGASVFVTGRGRNRFVTLAYDPTTGARQWLNRYSAAPHQNLPWAIGVSPDSSAVFVGGDATNQHGRSDMEVFALDVSTGRRLWANRFNYAHGNDDAYDLSVAPDGNSVAITGRVEDDAGHPWMTTAVYRAGDGDRLWLRRVTDGDRYGTGYALAFASTGQLVVTGGQTGRAVTLAYDPATGARIWLRRFMGRDLFDLAIDPGGSTAYLTGQSPAGVGPDFVTIAYSLV